MFCSSVINLIRVAYVVRRPCSDFTDILNYGALQIVILLLLLNSLHTDQGHRYVPQTYTNEILCLWTSVDNTELETSGVYPYLQMAQLSHGQFGGGDEKTLE